MKTVSNILLPIAGKGRRFAEKGYDLPKPLIMVGKDNKTILEKSLESVDYSESRLIFIVRQEHIDEFKIDKFLIEKYGSDIIIVTVDYDTDGAVNSCLLAEKYIDNDSPLIIFTPDCFFQPQFNSDSVWEGSDGMVVVFESENEAHSYVVLDDEGYVSNAAEKEVISHNAVGGLYYYRKGSDFVKYSKEMINRNQRVNGEFYICPVFNLLVEDGKRVGVDKNSRHVVLGTPEGLDTYLKGAGINV